MNELFSPAALALHVLFQPISYFRVIMFNCNKLFGSYSRSYEAILCSFICNLRVLPETTAETSKFQLKIRICHGTVRYLVATERGITIGGVQSMNIRGCVCVRARACVCVCVEGRGGGGGGVPLQHQNPDYFYILLQSKS